MSYNIIKLMEIKTKINEIMESKNISTVQLAELTGLTSMTIGNARRGKGINVKTAQKIARALNESIEKIWPLNEEGEAA
jgi:transcriptional regulator with XRE-family HTH domain